MSEEIIAPDTGAGDAVITDTVETAPIEAAVDGGDQPVQNQESDQLQDGQADNQDPDAAISSDQIKSHIEALKKTNPALAKEIKNLYFAQDAFKKEFPGGVPEVRQLKQTVADLGGTEGIEKLNAQRQEWEQIDTLFESADPKVFDFYIKTNPEAFASIIPKAVDRLAEVNRESYNHMLSGPFVATLDSWRLPDTLERLAENLAQIVDKDGKQICTREIQALQQIGQKYDGLRQLAEKAPIKKEGDVSKKLKEQEQSLAQERTKLNGEYVSNATETHAKKQYETLIASEARNQKLDINVLKTAGSHDRFMRQVDEEIAREIVKDKAAVQKIQSSIQAGRRDDAIKLSNAKFDAVVGKVVQKVVREWATLLNPKGISVKPNGNGAQHEKGVPAGVKKLESAPDTSQVDQTNPNWRNDYMFGTAKLKTGQRVQW